MAQSVLVVEDDAFVRTCTAEMISECGFAVIEAENADEAIGLIERDGHDIAVMVTDVRMPGALDGVDLARRVAERRPDIRILVTSGFEGGRRSELPSGVRFLAKPWRALDVINYVMEAKEDW